MKLRRLFGEFKKNRSLAEQSSLKESQPASRMPIVYGDDDYLLSKKSAYTGMEIPLKSWGFLDREVVEQYHYGAEGVFRRMFPSGAESRGHLLYTNRVHSSRDWERGVVNTYSDPDREWHSSKIFPAYVAASRNAVDRKEFFVPSVFLYARLGTRADAGGWRGALLRAVDTFLSGFGLDDSDPDDKERELWPEQAANVADALTGSWLTARRIPRRTTEWLVRHLDTPSLPTPSLATADYQDWRSGEWRTTLASDTRVVDLGTIEKQRICCVEFDAPTSNDDGPGGGKAYAAYLPVSHAPESLGHEVHWLHHATGLPFPVDASVHFQIVDPERAEKELTKPINRAESQAEEKQDAGFRVDETTQTQNESLRQLKRSVQMGRQPLAYWQAVLRVYSTDKQTLKENVNALIRHYKDIHFELVCPHNDQRELHYQFIPGSDLAVNDWLLRTDPGYLAQSMPWLTTSVGDRTEDGVFGLYQGYTVTTDTTGRPRNGVPVFYDLWNVVDEGGKAPTEVVCGTPGSGKTVSRGLKVCHEDALRGVTQVVWDPKGDFLPLKQSAGKMGLNPDDVHLIDLTSPSNSVSMDAFAIAEVTPEEEIDERQGLAVDVLHQLCAELLPQSKAGEILTSAVKVVMVEEKTSGTPPTMEGVLEVLTAWSRGDIPDESQVVKSFQEEWIQTSRSVLDHLLTVRDSALGRLLFRNPHTAGAMDLREGTMTIFVASNLRPTDKDSPPTRTSRISDVIAGLMTDRIRTLVLRMPAEVPKSVVFDEWHVIKASSRAEAFADWQRRIGRSRRCVIRQLSQYADDFETGSLSTVWCGHAQERPQAIHSCKLLGIEPNESNVQMLMNLSSGEFLFKDVEGRVARVKVHIWEQTLFDRFNTQALARAALLREEENAPLPLESPSSAVDTEKTA